MLSSHTPLSAHMLFSISPNISSLHVSTQLIAMNDSNTKIIKKTYFGLNPWND